MANQPSNSIEFGYFPRHLDFTAGNIEVSTICKQLLPKEHKKIAGGPHTKGGWYFYHLPPFPLAMNALRFAQEWMKSERPRINDEKCVEQYLRKMELPCTHRLKHDISDGKPHLGLLVRLLGFFYGMDFGRTLTNNLGATPIRPHMLCDFYLDQPFYDNDQRSSVDTSKVQQAMLWAGDFVEKHNQSDAPDRLLGIISRLFSSQKMSSSALTESFDHLYAGLEACYGLLWVMKGEDKRDKRPFFYQKIERLCSYCGIHMPEWTKEVSDLHNRLLHESFLGDDGKVEESVELMLEVIPQMQRLLSRLIIAFLIGSDNAKECPYVQSPLTNGAIHSPITDRVIHELILPPALSA